MGSVIEYLLNVHRDLGETFRYIEGVKFAHSRGWGVLRSPFY